MATERIASWAVDLSYASLPPEVIQAAVNSFYNWVGRALGGVNQHPRSWATKARRVSARARPDASHAALINDIASHVHDYDDTHLATIIHPMGPVASALLAQAEALGGVKGEDFIVALVAGIEAQCKLGLGVWPKHYDIGWHITSTVGSIGAAVAVGKLMRLQRTPMQHAISIAATQVTGLREMFGSDTKLFHVGRAVQNGLLAAVLAARGYTGSLGHRSAARLGVWEIAANTFKPFPCGIVVHPIIDACIQLHHEMADAGFTVTDIASVHARLHHEMADAGFTATDILHHEMADAGFTATDIVSVHARVHPLVLELTGKKTPQDGLQAKDNLSCHI
ncbi:hypothetical protein GGX14DRAFT_627858 [Mycena pura]|uniref:MmgE/PrpD N-terminal domain-containing protein n=1 Tax=Mycena pura TaxID=153505 RepID=A0AAD6YR40_9AGAR|nr:hypothetical protein GGX14DRAFT_627858 [Mycena pura]